jgi:chromosome partitioning protein
LGDRVYQTVIPRSVRLSEAPSHGVPVHLYAPTSKGAKAYEALAAEFARPPRQPFDVEVGRDERSMDREQAITEETQDVLVGAASS